MRELLIKSISPFANFYTFIFPSNFGAKAIIRHGDEILLVRNAAGTRLWSLPGGGVDRGESPAEALTREVQEEVGVGLRDLAYYGAFRATSEYRRHAAHLFTAEADRKEFVIEPMEILEAAWFKPDELPLTLTPMTKKLFKKLKKNRQKQFF